MDAVTRAFGHVDTSVRTLAQKVDVRIPPLGVQARQGTCCEQAVLAHETLEDGDVVALRVGEFYDFYGTDAVVASSLCTDACTSRPSEQKCFVHKNRLQSVLSLLVRAGWRVAVHEESEVVCTPRMRVLCKLVTDATPVYSEGGGRRPCPSARDEDAPDQDDDTIAARPVLAIHARSDGAFDAVEFRLEREEMVVHAHASQPHVESLVDVAARPVACLRSAPPFVCAETCVLGCAPSESLVGRVLPYVAKRYGVDASAFRSVRADPRACAPTPRYTLEALGIGCSDARTPSLLEACCTKRASAAVREQMDAWIRRPPYPSTSVRRVVLHMSTNQTQHAPSLCAMKRNRWRAHASGGCDASHLVALRTNSVLWTNRRLVGDSDRPRAKGGAEREQEENREADVPALFVTIAASMGCQAKNLDVEGMLGMLNAFVDEKGLLPNLLVKFKEDVVDAEAKVEEWKQAQSYGTFTTLNGRVVMYGPPVSKKGNDTTGDDKETPTRRNPVRDRAHKIVPDRHTTPELDVLHDGLVAARDRLQEEEDGLVSEAVSVLRRTYDAEATVVNAYACAVACLSDHVRAVGRTWRPLSHVPSGEDATMDVRKLRPYWLSDSGVANDVLLRSGTPCILTGPNGGGKSTVLRSLAAAAVLTQIGCLAPAQEGSRLPSYSYVFLRAGSSDCASEGKSAFASEMADLSTVLKASAEALVLLDEPCRGTSTQDGTALLRAYVNTMPASATTVLSTHFLDMECEGCEHVQMVAAVDSETAHCRAEYRLAPGRCTNSLALHCALAAGMPTEVVLTARRDDDEETAVLVATRETGVSFGRMRPNDVPPQGMPHAVYVLLTTEGVYVGEARDLTQRLSTHSATKEIETVFYTSVRDRTSGLALETRLIQRLTTLNVRVLSVADGKHVHT